MVEIRSKIELSGTEKAALAKWSGVFDQLAGLASETLFRWRLENFIRVLDKADEIRKETNTDIRPLPPKFTIGFMEGASQEGDADMQCRWANLLVGAIAAKDLRHLEYSHVLSQILPEEATVLKEMWSRTKTYAIRDPVSKATVFQIPMVNPGLLFSGAEFLDHNAEGIDRYGRLLIGEILMKADGTPNDVTTALYGVNNHSKVSMLNHLGRLGLLHFANLGKPLPSGLTHKFEWCGLSGFGFDFVDACETASA